MRPSELWVCQLGSVPYAQALDLQQLIAERRRSQELPDTLLLLEHPLVFTRGRRAADGELPLGADFYRAANVEVIAVKRGGRLTCHGPGQLVGYPIMAVGDVLAHLRTIEAVLIQTLAELGLEARSRSQEGPDFTGVWVEDRKIASIGVHVARGVGTHGFALNARNDLEPFSWMIPCGLPGVQMTSIERELGASVDMSCLRKRVAHRFCAAHGARQRIVGRGRLEQPARALVA